MQRVYVGVDLGSSNFHQVAINEGGAGTLNREFATSEVNLVKAFTGMRGEIHVHLEAGELAPWASEIIRPLVHRVVCSHPQTNAWIARDRDKSDRVDAYKLASLLRMNELRKSNIRSPNCGAISKPWCNITMNSRTSRRG